MVRLLLDFFNLGHSSNIIQFEEVRNECISKKIAKPMEGLIETDLPILRLSASLSSQAHNSDRLHSFFILLHNVHVSMFIQSV